MPEGIPDDYQAILDQLHSDEFLQRLKSHMDPDGKSNIPETDETDLIDLVRRLQVQDASSSIDSKTVEMLLNDDEIRDNLLKATRSLMKSINKTVGN